jgi:hypothetical protein
LVIPLDDQWEWQKLLLLPYCISSE